MQDQEKDFIKKLEQNKTTSLKDSSKNYEDGNKLGLDYKKESENFTKDSIKRFSGDFKKAQCVKHIDLGIEYI